MAVTFKTIRPKGIKKEVFQKSFDQAAQDMAVEVEYEFFEATSWFKKVPKFVSDIKRTQRSITITTTTESIPFKYYDLGNGGPTRIIRPTRKKALHWVDNKTGEDVFRKWVHGYKGFEVSKKIYNKWNKRIAKYFDWYLKEAIKESGHALK
jgi:hypothetical protein